MNTDICDISLTLKGQIGAGSLNNVVKQCHLAGIFKPLIVTDPVMVAIGAAPRVVELFAAAGQAAVIFDRCVENPRVPDITEGAEAYRLNGCDGIIGLGGGSPLDQAKGVRLVAKQGGTALDYDALKGGIKKIKPELPPMVAIPTTSGTGSEATDVAMITDPVQRFKFPLKSPFLKPERMILDPELTKTMPPRVTAATGFDALVHALESYVNPNEDLVAYSLNRTVFQLIGRSLKKAVEDGDNLQARGEMAMAAMMAGVTLATTGLGAVHSLAHPLSSLADIPHGTANALMLPAVMRFNAAVAEPKYIAAVRLMGYQVETLDEAIACVSSLAADVGLPTTLTAAGVPETLLEQLSNDAHKDPTHRRNPLPTTREDLSNMYRATM